MFSAPSSRLFIFSGFWGVITGLSRARKQRWLDPGGGVLRFAEFLVIAPPRLVAGEGLPEAGKKGMKFGELQR